MCVECEKCENDCWDSAGIWRPRSIPINLSFQSARTYTKKTLRWKVKLKNKHEGHRLTLYANNWECGETFEGHVRDACPAVTRMCFKLGISQIYTLTHQIIPRHAYVHPYILYDLHACCAQFTSLHRIWFPLFTVKHPQWILTIATIRPQRVTSMWSSKMGTVSNESSICSGLLCWLVWKLAPCNCQEIVAESTSFQNPSHTSLQEWEGRGLKKKERSPLILTQPFPKGITFHVQRLSHGFGFRVHFGIRLLEICVFVSASLSFPQCSIKTDSNTPKSWNIWSHLTKWDNMDHRCWSSSSHYSPFYV